MPQADTPLEITELADVYAVPLAKFIAARDQLRSRLRSEGRDEEAKQVGALRKPSVAVWALNRAARLHPEHVERLLDGHRRIREADSVEA
ncbi:MAG TPA: hypothetical protein VIH55_07245, partial [Acidimicrobiia bacterium]